MDGQVAELASTTLWIILITRLVGAALGFGCIFMGYRLFMAGVHGQTGEVAGSVGGHSVSFKNAAPGAFFAICGTLIAGIALLAPRSVSSRSSGLDMVASPPPGTATSFTASPDSPAAGNVEFEFNPAPMPVGVTDSAEPVSVAQSRESEIEVHLRPAPPPYSAGETVVDGLDASEPTTIATPEAEPSATS